MMQVKSFTRVLPIKFEVFSGKFNEEFQFQLSGWTKLLRATNWKFQALEVGVDRIFVTFDRGTPIFCEYTPNSSGDTVLKVSVQLSFINLIIYAVSLMLLVGFLFVPIRLLALIGTARAAANKIASNSLKIEG